MSAVWEEPDHDTVMSLKSVSCMTSLSVGKLYKILSAMIRKLNDPIEKFFKVSSVRIVLK
jgi:hypothetical protein